MRLGYNECGHLNVITPPVSVCCCDPAQLQVFINLLENKHADYSFTAVCESSTVPQLESDSAF